MPEFANPADTYMRILANKQYPPSEKDLRKTNFIVKQYQSQILPGVLDEMG